MKSIEVKKLKKTYISQRGKQETKALDDVSFSIEAGDFVAVMGSSGSGKTTLFQIIAGIDRSYDGNVLLQGTDIGELTAGELATFRRRHIGMVFQDFNLIDSLNVRENIMIPMVLDDIDPDVIADRVAEVAQMAGMAHLLDREIYELSGGQQQRVAICRALLNQPELLLADEPTGNLDSGTAKNIMGYLRDLNREQQNTIIMVTHDAFAAAYCRKVIFLKDGAIQSHLEKQPRDEEGFFERILEKLADLERGTLSGGVA